MASEVELCIIMYVIIGKNLFVCTRLWRNPFFLHLAAFYLAILTVQIRAERAPASSHDGYVVMLLVSVMLHLIS